MISIHSLVKRETIFTALPSGNHINFNPLPRKEGDAMAGSVFEFRGVISIHSLVKRETLRF